jgi:hypothetical protein
VGRTPRCLNAGGTGQVEVHEHDVRCVVGQRRERFLGGADRVSDLDLGHRGEQPGQAITEDRVVVDDQHPDHACTTGAGEASVGAVTAGSCARTVTPGAVPLTVRVPPSSSARSRMMASPLP